MSGSTSSWQNETNETCAVGFYHPQAPQHKVRAYDQQELQCEKCSLDQHEAFGMLICIGLVTAMCVNSLAFIGMRHWRSRHEKRQEEDRKRHEARRHGGAGSLGKISLGRTPRSEYSTFVHSTAGLRQAHAFSTLSVTSSGYQFLMLYEIHLSWPRAVLEVWQWLTGIMGLAFLRLEFLAVNFRSLCIMEYFSTPVRMVIPFGLYMLVHIMSKCYAMKFKRQLSKARRVVKKSTDKQIKVVSLESAIQSNISKRDTELEDRGLYAYDRQHGMEVATHVRTERDGKIAQLRRSLLWHKWESDAFRENARIAEGNFKMVRFDLDHTTAVAIIVYSQLFTVMASKTIQPFCCERLEGILMVQIDNESIPCFTTSAQWLSLAATGSVLFIIFAIIMPLQIFRGLQRLGQGTRSGNVRYMWFTRRFRSKFWYWEFVLLLRKLVFVILGTLPKGSFLLWAMYLLGTVTNLALQVSLEPFGSEDEPDYANKIERNNLLAQTATLCINGVMIFVEQQLDHHPLVAHGLSVTVVTINFVTLWPIARIIFDKRCCR
jgi:hypothetical protein